MNRLLTNLYHPLLAGFVGLLLLAGTAAAGPVIYNNGAPDGGFAYFIDDFENGRYEGADDFYLAEGGVIADIHFTTVESGEGYTGLGIEWTIYEEDYDGAEYYPGDVFASGYAQPDDIMRMARTDVGDGFFEYWFYLDEFVTIPNDSYYWLGLHFPGTHGTIRWATTDTGGGEYAAGRGGLATQWHRGEGDVELAFQLTTVPEPSILALLGIGLAGMGFTRKRMKA